MLGDVADYANYTLTFNDLALFTDSFDRSSYLHLYPLENLI